MKLTIVVSVVIATAFAFWVWRKSRQVKFAQDDVEMTKASTVKEVTDIEIGSVSLLAKLNIHNYRNLALDTLAMSIKEFGS